VLDITATDDRLGKPAGKDMLEGVYTLPVIYALTESDALRSLLGQPIEGEQLVEARELASANGAVDLALSVARAHAVKAADALEGAEGLDTHVCDELGSLVDGLVTRES
jgi:geranylgeranyl pyrophosphate synthase